MNICVLHILLYLELVTVQRCYERVQGIESESSVQSIFCSSSPSIYFKSPPDDLEKLICCKFYESIYYVVLLRRNNKKIVYAQCICKNSQTFYFSQIVEVVTVESHGQKEVLVYQGSLS